VCGVGVSACNEVNAKTPAIKLRRDFIECIGI